MKKKKYVAYYRRSVASVLSGIEAQRSNLARFLSCDNCVIAEFIEDEEKAGADRPELIRALNMAYEKKAVLAIAELGDPLLNGDVLEKLRDVEVKFVCVDLPEITPDALAVLDALARRSGRPHAERVKPEKRAARTKAVKVDLTSLPVSKKARGRKSKQSLPDHDAKLRALGKFSELPADEDTECVEVVKARTGDSYTRILTGFDGARGEIAGLSPPDVAISAGWFQIVEATNVGVRIMSKTGKVLFERSLKDFFDKVGASSMEKVFDPRTTYDPFEERFSIIALGVNEELRTAMYFLAVSKTRDALGEWFMYAIQAVEKINGFVTLPDFTSLGFDQQFLYFTSHQFAVEVGGQNGGAVVLLDKTEVYSGSLKFIFKIAEVFSDDFPIFFRAVRLQSSSARGFMLGCSSITKDGTTKVFLVLWTCVREAGMPVFTKHLIEICPFSTPGSLGGRQKGGCAPLEPDGFPFRGDMYWRNGYLTGVWTTPRKWSVENSTLALRILKLHTGTLEVERDILFGDPDHDYFYGNSMLDDNGDTHVVFTRSGPMDFPGFGTVVNPWNNEAVVMVKDGAVCYENIRIGGRNRWGDYLSLAPDPKEDGTVWIGGEYPVISSQWGTWIAHQQYVFPGPTALQAKALYDGVRDPRYVDDVGIKVNLTWLNRSTRYLRIEVQRRFHPTKWDPTPRTAWDILTSIIPPADVRYQDKFVGEAVLAGYRVRAYGNHPRLSEFSDEAIVLTPLLPVKFLFAWGKPGGSVDLTWDNQSKKATAILVERRLETYDTPGVFFPVAELPAAATSYTDSGLFEGAEYNYRLTAAIVDYSSGMREVLVTSPGVESGSAVIPLVPPTNLEATARPGGVADLQWQSPSAVRMGSIIERKGPGDLDFADVGTVWAPEVKFTDRGLTANATYEYRVREGLWRGAGFLYRRSDPSPVVRIRAQ